ILGATPMASQGFAFDGAPVSPDTAIPVVSAQPGAAAALKKVIPPPTPDTSLTSLQYAAEGGHPVAQWKLGRMYADGDGVAQDDFRYAARWLGLAAQKGQHQAQALLGQMLFNGDQLPRQAARGLMWLTLARDSAAPDEIWIKESYNRAIAKASEDDRAMALQMLEHWVQGRKD